MAKPVKHDSKVGDLFYRIDDRMWSYVVDADSEEYGSYLGLQGSTYKVVGVTPCGVWLDVQMDKPRFVNLGATKKFADPTKEQAIIAFKARKARQAKIHRARVQRAERAAEMATSFDRFPENPIMYSNDLF